MIARLLNRAHEIATYGSLAGNLSDVLPLALLGCVRLKRIQQSKLLRSWVSELRVRPKALRGACAVINPFDCSHLLVFDEIFLSRVYNLDLLKFDPDGIIDCGGHIGLFSLLACKRFPKADVSVFEPAPENAIMIKRQQQLNSVGWELVEAAVSDITSEVWFGSGISCGGRLLSDCEAKSTTAYKVKGIELAGFLRRKQYRKLLLKMDIEGAEESVLPSILACLPQTCAIFFEVHRGRLSLLPLERALRGANFEVTQLNDRSPFLDCFAIRDGGASANLIPRRDKL